MEERNIRGVVEYDGTRYSGFQRQRGVPTIEGEILKALERLVGFPVDIQGASRTDAGVHAMGQVFHFHLLSKIPTSSLERALNGILPGDIVIQKMEEVQMDFQARFWAKGKHYFYQVLNRSRPSAFLAPYSLHFYHSLNLEQIERGALTLLGRRDFSSFEAKGSPPRDPHCHLWAIQVEKREDLVIIHVKGDRFLYKMVRILVGTLLEVGRGKIKVLDLPFIIESRDRTKAGPTARAEGLFLKEVYY